MRSNRKEGEGCVQNMSEGERTHSYKYKMKVGAYSTPMGSHKKHVSEDSHEQIIYLIGAQHYPPPCK